MTARVLNLGLVRIISDFGDEHMVRAERQAAAELAQLEALQRTTPPSPSSAALEQRVAEVRAHVDRFRERSMSLEWCSRDAGVLQQALCFYHAMALFLARLLGGFQVPPPLPCPMEFAAMPEHFVEDLVDVVVAASRDPAALQTAGLEDFMSLLVMLMGSPLHVKNPYLRAKCAEVMQLWLPAHQWPHLKGSMAALFAGHPFAMRHLTPTLLKLFVDVEFTGAHNAVSHPPPNLHPPPSTPPLMRVGGRSSTRSL